MRVLYAPWRYAYIKNISEEEKSGRKRSCVFCSVVKRSDEEGLILIRGRHSFVIMNLFPYNTGHVMVVPLRHVDDFTKLSLKELCEMHMLVEVSINALRKAFQPHGFNIGINLGRVAGAGIEDHIHVHIVPRWNGDTNFMPVIGNVKVIPQDVRETYSYLRPFFREEYKSTIPKYRSVCNMEA